jgi:hypothetical protein
MEHITNRIIRMKVTSLENGIVELKQTHSKAQPQRIQIWTDWPFKMNHEYEISIDLVGAHST